MGALDSSRSDWWTPALWTCAAAVVGVLPLYPTYWWWDLAAHALASVAILSVVRHRARSWRLPFVVLVTLSVLWEWGEYLLPQPWLIVPTVRDTLLDLTVMFCVGYLYYRTVESAATEGS